MAYKDKDEFDPTKAPEGAKMYADNVSAGDRLKSTFDSSQVLGTDGKFFGMPVSNGMAGTFRFLLNQALPEVVEYVGNHSTQVAQKFAKNYLGKDPKAAFEFGKHYGKGITYGVVLIQPAAELAAIAYHTSSRMNELRQALVPILKVNGQSTAGAGIFSDSNNEVIRNARNKIFTGAKNDLIGTAAQSVMYYPAMHQAIKKENSKRLGSVKDAEMSHIMEHGTAEEKSAYFKERLKSNFSSTAESNKMLREQLVSEEKAYKERFKQFKSDHSAEAGREIRKAQKDGDMEYQEMLERLGFGKPSVMSFGGNSGKVDEKKLKEALLKEKFALQEGPWDESWLTAEQKQMQRGGQYINGQYVKPEKIETYKGLLEGEFKKELDRINGVKSEKDKKDGSNVDPERVVNHMTQAIATLAGEALRGFVTSDTNKELEQKLALDMILNFRRQLDENRTRDTIPGGVGQNKSEEYSYAQYVHKIFQENQADGSLSEIGDRYVKSMRAVNWGDEDIQKMKDSDLNEYEVAIKHISQYIRDGRMDPLALINLVGERKIVQRSGKSFGTLKTKDQEALKENIIAEIDKQAALLRPNHKMDQDEVSQALGNYTFTKEELQAAFSNHGLDADAKAFLFTLLDMNTPDDAVLKDLTGRPESEIKQMRLDAQKRFSNEMDAALREIAGDLKTNPAAIERYDLTEEEASRFTELYRKGKEAAGSLGDALNADNRNVVAASVANILVDDGLHHSGRFWRERVKPHAEKTLLENKVEAKAKQEEKESLKQEAFENEENFADKINQATNDNYMENMPYVSKEMHERSRNKQHASHAHKLDKRTHQELGMGA